MFNPIKERVIDDNLISFFHNLDLDDRINVPYLSDGTFELIMAQKNSVFCVPINPLFNNLWNLLISKPSVVSLMIERCEDTSSSIESLLKHKNKLVSASNLINACRRSKEEVLMNNMLIDKDKVFSFNYHKNLKNFKTNIKLADKIAEGAVFQDLTYLNNQQKTTLLEKDNCLLVTNKEEDLKFFSNFEKEQFANYYLLWSKNESR